MAKFGLELTISCSEFCQNIKLNLYCLQNILELLFKLNLCYLLAYLPWLFSGKCRAQNKNRYLVIVWGISGMLEFSILFCYYPTLKAGTRKPVFKEKHTLFES